MKKSDAAGIENDCNHELAEFDYALPKDLIAAEPLDVRDSSKLLRVSTDTGQLSAGVFTDVLHVLSPGDVLVMNKTKVFQARLRALKKDTGGKVEVMLVASCDDTGNLWHVLIQPKLKPNQEISFDYQGWKATALGKDGTGYDVLRFNQKHVMQLSDAVGEMPLPNYLKRPSADSDKEHYQTVYAEDTGSIAAPTAGLHFTDALIEAIRAKGVEIAWVTLHVGYGTFQSIRDLKTHQMHEESFDLPQATVDQVRRAKKEGKKVWAVGTTAIRTLETCVVDKVLIAGQGETNLFIYPPFKFEIVDGIITNFHLPKSSLFILVSAFMGLELTQKAYAHAITEKFRFFSYGDAMIIE